MLNLQKKKKKHQAKLENKPIAGGSNPANLN
jgi:hypothetical protein